MKVYLKTQRNITANLLLVQIPHIMVDRNILYTIYIFSPNLVLYSFIYSNQSMLGIIPKLYNAIPSTDTKK